MDTNKKLLEGKSLRMYEKLISNLNICTKKGWTIIAYEQRCRYDKKETKDEN